MKNLFIKLLKKFRLLKFVNIYGSATINSKKIVVPLLGGMGEENLSGYETWLTQVLIKLKPFSIENFVDVGINLGQTLIKAYTVFDDIVYVGFEPNLMCVNYANDLVNVNNFKNCTIIPAGISDKTEVLKLNFYHGNKTDSTASIIEQFRPTQPIHHSMFVPVFNFSMLTHVLKKSNNAILKIDVEGAELEVLAGLAEWIKECQPIILIEVLPVYDKKNSFRLERQQKIEALLHSLNYKIARINKTTIHINELDEIGIHGNIVDSDYISYPAGIKESIYNIFR